MTTSRPLPWWKRGSREYLIAGIVSVAILIVAIALMLWWRTTQQGGGKPSRLVKLTLVENAQKTGAVCLDGSPPGYYLQRGFGSGYDNWVIHLEGGAWCGSVKECSERKLTRLGSSNYMEHEVLFEGILSNEVYTNPDFFNWNLARVPYCDGASFSGDVESQFQNGTELFFRGQRIWNAVMNEFLSKGLSNAKQVLLTGCSAGGLATFIHCDNLRDLLPKSATVKCFSDGGFFLDERDISGRRTMKAYFSDVVILQNAGKSLIKDCITRNQQSDCFFPKKLLQYIQTPLFILNSAYDSWQIRHILVPEEADPNKHWEACRADIRRCDSSQLQTLHGFREALLNSLSDYHQKGGNMFIMSCFEHCLTISDIKWHSPQSPRIKNKTIAESIGDWYFDRQTVQTIDCPFPCNPTCLNDLFR